MKKNKLTLLLFIFLLLHITFNIYGEFWIKKSDTRSGQLIYDVNNGLFFSVFSNFSIFDLTGKLYKQSFFYTTDNKDPIVSVKTIRLNDGTFVGVGHYSSFVPIIFRFNQDGEILFAKELKENMDNFYLRDILHIDNKLKIFGYYRENFITKISILTLSMNGDLLKSKKIYSNKFSFSDTPPSVLLLDPDHYVMIIAIRDQWSFRDGFFFLKLNMNDEIKKSNIYYINPDFIGRFSDPKIIKNNNKSFYLFLRKNKNNNIEYRVEDVTFCLLKLDSNWKIEFSKEYIPEWDFYWFQECHFLGTENGCIMCLNKQLRVKGEDSVNPVLVKLNQDGSIIWSKKYNTKGHCWQKCDGLSVLPNGGFAMSTTIKVFYILNKNGEVSEDCHTPENASIKVETTKFIEATPNTNDLRISNLNFPIIDIDVFLEKTAVVGDGIKETYCEYKTIEGGVTFFMERSIFFGYYIHKINFSVDPMILPYIDKFKIYRQYRSENYVFVSEISKEQGKTNYEVELKPLYSKDYNYKIVGVNSKDEVVDISIIE